MRPVWVPIYLRCKKCQHDWDDWQPNCCPIATWVAHVQTYRCPQCGAGHGNILLRTSGPSELGPQPIAEMPS